MRTILLTSVAAFGLAVALPALAATDTAVAPGYDTAAPTTSAKPYIPPPRKLMREGAMNPATGARWGHVPGSGVSLPTSTHASNITPGDTASLIAPTLPTPPLAKNATPEQFLSFARQALSEGRTGAAQEALERAETRRLDRDAMRGISPSNDPMVSQIEAALDAIARRNFSMAQQSISTAMAGGGAGSESIQSSAIEPGMAGDTGTFGPQGSTGVYQAEPHQTSIPGTNETGGDLTPR